MLEQINYSLGAQLVSAPKARAGLYLVATPIGNLKDISIRALEVLAGVDYIACEDTRTSRKLLSHYGIAKKLIAYHEHNAKKVEARLLALLKGGASVALLSDAGTPLISDPGFPLVHAARAEGIEVFSLPGASALLVALTLSGLPTDQFAFMGFLPAKQKARLAKLKEAKAKKLTTIFYEAPHRLLDSLEDAINVYGGRHRASIARELTKKFETVSTDFLENLYQFYSTSNTLKGEIVFLLAPYQLADKYDPQTVDALLLHYAKLYSPAKAATEVAQQTGEKKSVLYQKLLTLKAL